MRSILAWFITAAWLGAALAAPPDGVPPIRTAPATPKVGNWLTQSVEFPPLYMRELSESPFMVSATASSGLPVSFFSQTPATCTALGWVTLVAEGYCTIMAVQSGNAIYASAWAVRTFYVYDAGGTPPPRLGNLSTRAMVLNGNDSLFGGFVIAGSAPKTVAVRARGASLGMPGVLTYPQLELYSGQARIGYDHSGMVSNDTELAQLGFRPPDWRDAAILATLAPGAYTVIVSGQAGGTGVGLFEVFEVDRPEVPLMNVATRGRVLGGDQVMIAGFVIQGSGPQTVVVRARGPSLAPFGVTGVLADPALRLVRSDGTIIADNDNWGDAGNAAAIAASGFAPLNSAESAILVTLETGAYTAIVSGVVGGTGVAIVEVFKQ